MACGRNQECLRIANSIYPGLIGDVNEGMSKLNHEIAEVLNTIDHLEIPDDYLGEIVSNNINNIIKLLSDDVTKLGTENSDVNNFVKNKITEHKKHYEIWQANQARIRREREEKNKENNDSIGIPTEGKPTKL